MPNQNFCGKIINHYLVLKLISLPTYNLTITNCHFYNNTLLQHDANWIKMSFNPIQQDSDFQRPCRKNLLKTLWGKYRKCWLPAFSPFLTMFSTLPSKIFTFWAIFIVLYANAFNLDKSKILLFGKELTLSQISPGFYVSAVQVFWKH